MMQRFKRFLLSGAALVSGLLVSVFLLAACDSAGPSAGKNADLQVGFATANSGSGSSSAAGTFHAAANGDSLTIDGSNGTLILTDIRLIVSELELEGEADSAEFEADPAFLDLPLNTTEVAPVASDQVPPATYSEFEFEVEDVEVDEEDDEESVFRAVRDSIQKDYPDWPSGASMVAVGRFVPDGDTARTFTAFFEAEIEVEQTLNPPLDVTSDGLSRRLTVKLDPAQWFSKSDGTVENLATLDYDRTGELIEFEAEFEDGVTEIEIDSGDDDD